MATNITWPPIGGASFSIPAAGEVGWPALSNFLIALQNAQSNEAQQIAVRTATTTPINVASASDCVVRVELSVPGPAGPAHALDLAIDHRIQNLIIAQRPSEPLVLSVAVASAAAAGAGS